MIRQTFPRLIVLVLHVFALVVTAGKYDNQPFPDRSTKPLRTEDALEIVAELPARPGNVDVDPQTETVFFTFHPLGNPNPPCKVCRLEDTTNFKPFGDQSLFTSVLSVRVAAKKRQVLALDYANFGESKPGLIILDINTGDKIRVIEFKPEIAGKGSFLNDFVLSKEENFVFIADSAMGAEPAIITVDLKSGTSKRSLVSHESTKVRPTPPKFSINGTEYKFSFQVGVDSIGISSDGNVLYFASIFDPL